jgi:hypothetical protein
MDTYTISDDIKGSRRPFFRDEFEEWMETACEQRQQSEFTESRYEKWQREEFEKLDEEGVDRTGDLW